MYKTSLFPQTNILIPRFVCSTTWTSFIDKILVFCFLGGVWGGDGVVVGRGMYMHFPVMDDRTQLYLQSLSQQLSLLRADINHCKEDGNYR